MRASLLPQKNSVIRTLVSFLTLATLSFPTHAEKADQSKPTQIESEKLTYDDLQQVSVFSGKVLLTKGSIRLTADHLELRQDPQGYQFGIANGSPAHFRQRRDGPGNSYIEAFGQRMNYDDRSEILRIEKDAIVRRLEDERIVDEVRGDVITYDQKTEFYRVESGRDSGSKVRMIIQPKGVTSTEDKPSGLKVDSNLREPQR